MGFPLYALAGLGLWQSVEVGETAYIFLDFDTTWTSSFLPTAVSSSDFFQVFQPLSAAAKNVRIKVQNNVGGFANFRGLSLSVPIE